MHQRPAREQQREDAAAELAAALVTEHDDRATPRRGKIAKPNRVVGQFHPDDRRTVRVLLCQPGQRVVHPMHTGRPAQRVPCPIASSIHGRRGTTRHAPTASQVRSKVPRLTPYLGDNGAANR
jgi:hypothetical protein